MSKQLEQVKLLQTQVSTGQKIQLASEDPALANRIIDVHSHIQRLKGFEQNSILAENRTKIVAEGIQDSVNLTNQIQEVLIHAQNDTLSNSDRSNLAEELKGYLQNIMDIANTQDSDGNYIFSGMNVGIPAFIQEGSQYVYQGSQDGTQIPIGEHINVIYNESGYQLFDSIKLGNGTFTVSADSVNNTGTGVINPGNLSSSTNYIQDDYKITIVTNASGQIAYQLIATNGGQLIPIPPATTPDNAPAYIAGQTIEQNGISIQITGEPNVGDTFSIETSTTDNIFNILQNMINTLSTPIYSEKEKTDLHQALSDQASNMKQVSNHFQTRLVDAGYRGKMIDDYLAINQNRLIDAEIMFGKLSDTDLGQAISELTQRLTTLEVTQQTYLKIQETYFDLLNS